MKKAIILAFVIISSLASYIIYQHIKVNEFIDAASPHLKNTSLRVANEISYELDANSNITFKELLNKLEEDISEMDKRKLEVETVTNEQIKDISFPAIEYIKASQVFARSLLDYNRKLLAMSSASSWMDRQLEAYNAAAGSYSREYETTATDKALEDLQKAKAELLEADQKLLDSSNALKASREVVAKIFPNDALAPQDNLNALIKKLSTKTEATREYLNKAAMHINIGSELKKLCPNANTETYIYGFLNKFINSTQLLSSLDQAIEKTKKAATTAATDLVAKGGGCHGPNFSDIESHITDQDKTMMRKWMAKQL